MSIRSGLFSHLSGTAAITAIVGTSPKRIYPVFLPQGRPHPALIYKRIDGGHDHNLKGSAGHATGKFQIDALSDSYEGADTLAEAVRQAMDGFGGTFGSTDVRSVKLDDEEDDYVEPFDASDEGVFVITLTYSILYAESIPTP